jgi:hypothetical protein
MGMNLRLRTLLLSTLFLAAAVVAAPPRERGDLMTQHVREQVRTVQPIGALPAGKVLRFDMLLPLSAPSQLDQFLADVYNPASPGYRRFLTPAQFTERFGPSAADWNALLTFAGQNGFTIVGGSRDEMDLRLSGSVRAIEAAFHVKLRVYQHPTENRTYYSPDTEPTVDMATAVWHVSGLDNYSLPHARVHARAAAAATPLTTTGACPGNSYCGSDMRAAYYGTGALTGAGQTIGLVEFYGYDSADLATYFSTAGQTNKVPVNGISTDGSPLTCPYSAGCDDTEQTLDITQALGMAPGLAQLNVYVGGSDTAILSAMSVPPAGSVTGKVDAQLSCSWGWGPADPSVDDPLFKKFAAQGQSFFTAAGDSAAYTTASQAVFPADDANVTVVGGTDLSTAGPGGAWLYESAWSNSGGGYFAADNIAIPAWQTAAVTAFNAQSASKGSTTFRNSPDVAGEANFDFYVCADQQACTQNRYGGTSFAAPMWAGYMALANQQASINGAPPVGFLNPALYAVGNSAGTAYAKAFHDVTAGTNGYTAVSGYDLATGWGSPNGAGLIAALVGSTTPGFSLGAGGSLTVAEGGAGSEALTTTVSGGFNAAIALSAGGQPSGVSVSFSPASITGAGTSTVTFQVATAVPAGTYPITLTGTAAATGAGAQKTTSTTTVTLTVLAPNFAIFNGGALTVPTGGTGAATVTTTVSGGFNAAIALSAAGQPGGVTVKFTPASITGAGSATVSFQVAATTAAGTYPIVITGANGNLAHATTLNLTVAVPGFSLTSSAAGLSALQGGGASTTVTSAATGGFNAPIALSATGAPSGVTVSFAPATINGAGASTVNVAVAPTAAAGTYPLVITGSSGSLKQTLSLSLSVGAAGFTLTGAAPSIGILPGATGAVGINTAVNGTLNAPITLSVSGLPAGVTATLSTTSVVPPSAATLNFSVAATAAAGSFPITVSGVSGGASAKLPLTLVVGTPSKPTFAFSVGTTAVMLVHGTSTSFTVQTASAGSTAPSVALSISGLPAGITASFSPATLSGAGTSVVTLSGASSAKTGSAVLTVAGVAASNTETSTLTLTVN